MDDVLGASYDEFPYESHSYPATHPRRLATLGALFGLTPAPPERCRVLELGCASGGNLIPLAASLPGGEFLGIDLSAVQIERGSADIARLGLDNVRLLAQSILDAGPQLGEFDYILAHGVFSWVPGEVQEKILQLCARHLAPAGIAYISYNTLPGWHMRGVVRDAMNFHVQQFKEPATRAAQARAVLDFLAEASADPNLARGTLYGSAYAEMLRAEREWMAARGDAYLLHDHLEVVNEPFYFHVFIERAARHGLAYLAESEFRTMLTGDLAPPIADILKRISSDEIRREQFLDFLRNRSFRQTLLVRPAQAARRRVTPERLLPMHLATRAAPFAARDDTGAVEFRTPAGASLTTREPVTKAALRALAEKTPGTLSFDELLVSVREEASGLLPDGADVRQALAQQMLQCYGADIVELHCTPPVFAREAEERPHGDPVARLQAERGLRVTNLLHESITLDDASRRLLTLLDGRASRAEIARTMWPAESAVEAGSQLDRALQALARLCLLVR